MQRRRPKAGQNKDGVDCERDPRGVGGLGWQGGAGVGATLAPSSTFSTQRGCLISGQPERDDIRTAWSEELLPIFNEQLVILGGGGGGKPPQV